MQKGYGTVTIDWGGEMWIQRAFKTPGVQGFLAADFAQQKWFGIMPDVIIKLSFSSVVLKLYERGQRGSAIFSGIEIDVVFIHFMYNMLL